MEEAFFEDEATAIDAYYLGRAVAANILAAYKPYTANAALTRYVNSICQAIAINSVYPEYFNGYHVIILDSQEFNAFASPGGHIFLTRGLVEAANSEDMLAAIIAHELAHIMLKHSLSIIEDIRLHDEMSAMAERAAQFAGNSEAASKLMYFRNSVAATVDALVKNGYSQDQEFEADTGAVVLMAAAGYNPIAILEMLTILQSVQSSQKGGFNTTHPSPAQRIENVIKYVSEYAVQDTRASRAGRFRNK
jgi:predicted Zn-dependent protease